MIHGSHRTGTCVDQLLSEELLGKSTFERLKAMQISRLIIHLTSCRLIFDLFSELGQALLSNFRIATTAARKMAWASRRIVEQLVLKGGDNF